jgi:predicted nuclease of predicted toxin-antitoxin system
MLRLASDADVHGEIIRGLRRRLPEIDLVRAQDVLPEGTADSEVLAWAAAEGRVLITNDRNTMIALAYRRVAGGELVPGLIVTTSEQ